MRIISASFCICGLLVVIRSLMLTSAVCVGLQSDYVKLARRKCTYVYAAIQQEVKAFEEGIDVALMTSN